MRINANRYLRTTERVSCHLIVFYISLPQGLCLIKWQRFFSSCSVWITITEFSWIERQFSLRPNAAFPQNDREENMGGLPFNLKNVKKDLIAVPCFKSIYIWSGRQSWYLVLCGFENLTRCFIAEDYSQLPVNCKCLYS